MRDKERLVDELLDSALAHGRPAQPRPGLEARILERARATAVEEITRGKAWKLWIAAAAMVAVVMFVAIRVANRSHGPAAEPSQTAGAVPAAPVEQILTANSGTAPDPGSGAYVIEPKQIAHRDSTRSRRVEAHHHWPSQFPTPAPLTPEQKALVQYVRATPPKVLAASLFPHLSASQATEIKPVQFSSIQIQPLTVIKPGEELQ